MKPLQSSAIPQSLTIWFITAAAKIHSKNLETFLKLAVYWRFNEYSSSHTEPAWKLVFKYIWKLITTVLWIILILIILSSLGRSFAFGSPINSELNSEVNSVLNNNTSTFNPSISTVDEVQPGEASKNSNNFAQESSKEALKPESNVLTQSSDLASKVKKGDFIEDIDSALELSSEESVKSASGLDNSANQSPVLANNNDTFSQFDNAVDEVQPGEASKTLNNPTQESSKEALKPESNVLRPSTDLASKVRKDDFIKAIDSALELSRKEALKSASDDLDKWIGGLMLRVDNPNQEDFLDWYFNYGTQFAFGLKGVFQAAIHTFNGKAPTAQESLKKEVLDNFTNRVLRPGNARLEIKNIALSVADIYSSNLSKNLEKARIKYNFPKSDWDTYLQELTVTVTDVEGKQVPLQFKTFTLASLGGGALLTKTTLVAIEKVIAKLATKTIAKGGASVLSKTGALVGVELIAPAVTILIFAWDVWDNHNTEVTYRPILKQNLQDYFNSMKMDILKDPENGIEKELLDIEKSINKGAGGFRFPFFQ